MISVFKAKLKEILLNYVVEAKIEIGDFEHWTEAEDKSALIEWISTTTIARTISKKASIVDLNVYYIEAVPISKDKEPYLANLKLLVNDLMDSENLGKIFTELKVSARKVDRGTSNNNNYITKINITGQLPLL